MDFDLQTDTITTSAASGILTVVASGGVVLPVGTTSQRPSTPQNGTLRYNTTLSSLDIYVDDSWQYVVPTPTAGTTILQDTFLNRPAAGTSNRLFLSTDTNVLYRDTGTIWSLIGNSGTVTSIAATAPAAGFTISGSPVTSSGTLTFTLSDDLAAVEGLSTTGIIRRTATNTWSAGGAVTVAEGGTNLSSLGTSNQILGVNAGATALEYKTITAGSGITVTPAAGSITIAATNTGTVTSVALSAPSFFSVSGSPVTTNGTLSLTLNSQTAKYVLAAPTGAAGVPSFRQLSLSDNSDIDFSTSPQTNNVLKYDGSHWVPSQGSAGSYSTVISVWYSVGDGTYYADVTHNLNTRNINVSLYNNTTNSLLHADKITLTTTNTIRIISSVNTYVVRCVIIADGQTVSLGSGTIIVKDEGTNVANTPHGSVNFVGSGVTVTDVGGIATVTIPGGGSIKTNTITAFMFDSPNNSDWAINALAPAVVDPTNSALATRQFSNTTEQGVGFILQIPSTATSITFKFRGRASTAPGATAVVQPRLYSRLLPNNTAVGAWSSAFEFGNISIPTNAFYQYSTQAVLLSTLGLTAGNSYQFELTRRVSGITGGTNLASNWLMVELSLEFI